MYICGFALNLINAIVVVVSLTMSIKFRKLLRDVVVKNFYSKPQDTFASNCK